MIFSLLSIALGLILLIGGGELLLRSAVRIAHGLKLTPAVIGLTVVAAATSVPELAVSVGAAFSGKTDIAMGNVVGSNIANIALILGLSALIRPLGVTGNMIRLEYPVMWLVSFLLFVLVQDGSVSHLDSLFMIVFYLLFTAYLIGLVRTQLKSSENTELSAEVEELNAKGSLVAALGLVVVSIALLAAGAEFTVYGAVEIARIFGISERIIGLTIVAVGTSLPEIVASTISAYRGRGDIAIANIVGSNIFNILGILGLSGLATSIPVNQQIAHSDILWMLGISTVLFPIMHSKLQISRKEGGFLIAVYGVYLAGLL